MDIEFRCPECQGTIITRFLNPGDIAQCKNCRAEVQVPAEGDVAKVIQKNEGRKLPDAATGSDLRHTPDAESYLASRWKRLFGFLIDYWLLLIPTLIVIFIARPEYDRSYDSRYEFTQAFTETDAALIIVLISLVYAAIQIILLLRRAQTVGKLLLGTRIVSLDNTHPVWWKLIIVRPLVPYLATLKPTTQWTDEPWGVGVDLVFRLMGLVDSLMIFQADKRTLHDLMAGPTVIAIRKQRTLSDTMEKPDSG